jgi:hypothetical protein
MQTDRFLVPQYEGGLHAPHRQYKIQTAKPLTKLRRFRRGDAQ